MLGQPLSMLIPRVLGVRLHGELPEGATATDLVLTVTAAAARARRGGHVRRVLRRRPRGSADRRPGDDRQHVARSSARPARSSRSTRRRSSYLPLSGRPARADRAGGGLRARKQGLWHDEDSEQPTFSETLELDLAEIVPSIAGPKRPQDRVALSAGAGLLPRRRWEATCRTTTRAMRPRPRAFPPATRRPTATIRPAPHDGGPELPRRGRARRRDRSSRPRRRAARSRTAPRWHSTTVTW